MSFNFDYPCVSGYLDWNGEVSGLVTPPITPLYSTPYYYPTEQSPPLPMPPLQLPLLPTPHCPTAPTTPLLTPDYSLSAPVPELSTPDQLLIRPTTPPDSTNVCRTSTAIPLDYDYLYNPTQIPCSYTPALETVSRTDSQRFSPYQRTRKVSPKMKQISSRLPPRPTNLATSSPSVTSANPSLLEQAACSIISPSPTLTPGSSDTTPTSPPDTTKSPEPVLKPLARRRKPRVELTDKQKRQLELVFSLYNYLGTDVRIKVAEEVGLPEKTVLYWFQNRRARKRKSENSKKASQ